jgi:glutamate carboxypeptidase
MLSVNDFRTITNDMVDHLARLVSIESPTTDKAAVDRLGDHIAGELASLGAAVTVDQQAEAGDNLIGRWGAGGSGEVLLLCHMDTVYATGALAQSPLRIEDSRLFGPGTLDMKAGIVVTLTAIQQLRQRGQLPARPITALFTSDEETGSQHSRGLIEQLASQASLALCLEPGLANGALKTARKGTGAIEIVARGRAAHAGSDHENGRNAIEELAHHILAAQQLTDYARRTTTSVGLVSGGTRTNVVPDEARALIDVRVALPEEAARLQAWAQSLRPVLEGTQVIARLDLNRPPMPRDEAMIATFQKAQAIAGRLGLALREGGTGGASDANFVAPLGVPVLDGLGGLGEGAHSEREFVLIDSLPERAALLAALLTEW